MSTTNPILEQFSIVAHGERPEAPPRVLKQGDSFAVFDRRGDIDVAAAAEHGLYHAGTRFLSRLELLLAGHRPLPLSSTISDDNGVFNADLTNPDLLRDGAAPIPHGSIHVFRSRVLWAGCCIERVRLSSYVTTALVLPLAYRFEADYADVFEVRGTARAQRGVALEPRHGPAEQVLGYRGLDRVERRTCIRASREAEVVAPGEFVFAVALSPETPTWEFEITISCEVGAEHRSPVAHAPAVLLVREEAAARADAACRITTSNEALNGWISRSTADLHMMQTETPYGRYPYAGIPWFSTPFGRDGLITALQLLWADPDVARGVLGFLAATQATGLSDAQDAQPGKILHEMRDGEMPALGEVPFARYYGSADATPLFVLLAHRYFERTGDAALIDQLWPHLVAALEWMRRYGDVDGDGFIEYARRSSTGLIQQGWKDSYDSIFHADGTLAAPPIALCEVQAYAYGAWSGAAALAAMRGDRRAAEEWHGFAGRIQAAFEDAFWCESLDTYAVALDGEKRQCQVRTSNAGHALFTGIARPDRAARACSTLLDDSSFAGWGVRTVAAGQARYNPMSYHNGSIWPHDTGIVAAGVASYRCMHAAERIAAALLDLSARVDLQRLPELICGFHRRSDDRPTLYPVACAPQSWAAGAVYMVLQACLGMRVEAAGPRITFTRSVLPDTVKWVELHNVRVGAAAVDLRLERHAHDVSVNVLRREGKAEIVAIK
jgi:glycogen debranching enzyme